MGSTEGLCSSPRAWGCGWNGARLLCFAAINWGAAENTAAVIVVNQTPPSICAMKGSEFTIECTFNTNNNSIKWFAEWNKTRNNVTAKVNNGTDRIILSADPEKRSLSLTVKKADVTDSGTYVCGVGSKDGTYPGTGTQVTINGTYVCEVGITARNLSGNGTGTQVTIETHDQKLSVYIVLGAVVGTLLFFLVLGILLWRCRQCSKEPLQSRSETEMNQMEMSSPPPPDDAIYANFNFHERDTQAEEEVYTEEKIRPIETDDDNIYTNINPRHR